MKATDTDPITKSLITNYYEFAFSGQTITQLALDPTQPVSVLHAYKVTVHPKMEKSLFQKQREQLLFGFQDE
jgi:phosphoglycerate-specific signal transduction histidine kinase